MRAVVRLHISEADGRDVFYVIMQKHDSGAWEDLPGSNGMDSAIIAMLVPGEAKFPGVSKVRW